MNTLKAELHALNDAAYSAAKAARKEGDPRAKRLTELAWEIDDLIDQRPTPAPMFRSVRAAQLQEAAE